MTAAFVPCSACARHVKATDRTCPFCRCAVDTVPAPPIPRAAKTSRAALLAATAGAILGAAGCSSDDASPASDAGASDASVVVDASAAVDATNDVPTAQPLYGAIVMPMDAADDVRSVVTLYGGPIVGH